MKVRLPSNKIVMYYSFRSPYSQLVVDQFISLGMPGASLFKLNRYYNGYARLPVKRKKGFYIMSDAMREAYEIGFPWGSFLDPVGAGTIRAFVRGLNMVPEAMEEHFKILFYLCLV